MKKELQIIHASACEGMLDDSPELQVIDSDSKLIATVCIEFPDEKLMTLSCMVEGSDYTPLYMQCLVMNEINKVIAHHVTDCVEDWFRLSPMTITVDH